MLLGLCRHIKDTAPQPAGASDDQLDVERLTEIESVTLNLPGGRDFDCTVLAVAGVTAALRPLGMAIAKLPPRIDGVLLSFVSRRALVGLKGTLTTDGEVLRFSVNDGVSKSGRRSTRIDVALGAALRHLGRDERATATTINIATEGVLLRSALTVATGDVLALEIALPGTPLVTRGRVVRHADDLLAVEFHPEAHPIASEYVIAEKLRAQLV